MLDLKRQYDPLERELLEALQHVLETQQFILGEQVAAFEKAAAETLGVKHAIGCSSGTDALWLALAAAGIGEGDAVVTTPFSFFASVSAILRAGAKPLLADIDPVTFNLDPAAVEAVLKAPQTVPIRAVLPVHLYGQCADWDGFARLSQNHGLNLIEDAAQAWGAAWKGAKAGGLGDAAAFSFYPTKNLSAAGDAGMVTTNSDDVAELARALRLEYAVGWLPGRGAAGEAEVHCRMERSAALNRKALSCLVSRGGCHRGGIQTGTRHYPAAGSSRRTSRLASIRDSHGAAR